MGEGVSCPFPRHGCYYEIANLLAADLKLMALNLMAIHHDSEYGQCSRVWS